MKKGNGKLFVMAIFTVFIAVGTLVGAGILANYYGRDFSYTPSYTEYGGKDDYSSDIPSSSDVDSGEETSSTGESSLTESDTSSAETFPEIETGIYLNGEDSIVVTFYEAGFIEGNIKCGSITMEFSGQMIENTLTATGTDSLNNTVEIVLLFDGNKIEASSRPTIRYEENVDYLMLSGVFSR